MLLAVKNHMNIINILQMCEMIFEVQGKTDNYVRIEQDAMGIEFLGILCIHKVLHKTNKNDTINRWQRAR